MKRGYLAGFVLMVLLVSMAFISPLVSAGIDDDIKKGIDNLVNSDSIKTLLLYLVGGPEDSSSPYTGDMLFVKILFFILLIAITYYAAGKVPQLGENKWLQWIISIVISLLAIRFIASPALIEFIWLPNGVIGVVFAAFFPFIMYFFFIESFDRSIIRKVGWVAFIVIYIMLAIYRYDALAIVSGTETSAFAWNLAWIYLIIALLSFLVLLFDKPIRARWMLYNLKAKQSKSNILHIKRYMDELKEWDAAAHDMSLTPAQRTAAENEVKKLRNEIAKLS